jgi:hypothetical protein
MTEPFRAIIFVIGVLIGAILVDVAVLVQAKGEGLPYVKGHTQCSGSYKQSGVFCVPKSDRSPPAIPKPRNAQCPLGWADNGGSCEKR